MTHSARTVAQIDADIERVKAELSDVHGTETEVYARIVGYYRAVRNWNKGKRDEYDQRKMFAVTDGIYEPTQADSPAGCCAAPERIAPAQDTAGITKRVGTPAYTYELYTRATCPNCPPVSRFIEQSGLAGQRIDVDTDAGLARAAASGVFSTPTVIVRDADGTDIVHAHTVQELEDALGTLAPQAAQAVLA